jgi:urea transport system substrate-binding protein
LYSLTGTTAIIETSLNHATLMAIDEINAAGGVHGKKLVPVVEDPESDPATFAQKARKLVLSDRCVSVFGSYTSASRKAVLPVFEKYELLAKPDRPPEFLRVSEGIGRRPHRVRVS